MFPKHSLRNHLKKKGKLFCKVSILSLKLAHAQCKTLIKRIPLSYNTQSNEIWFSLTLVEL